MLKLNKCSICGQKVKLEAGNNSDGKYVFKILCTCGQVSITAEDSEKVMLDWNKYNRDGR